MKKTTCNRDVFKVMFGLAGIPFFKQMRFLSLIKKKGNNITRPRETKIHNNKEEKRKISKKIKDKNSITLLDNSTSQLPDNYSRTCIRQTAQANDTGGRQEARGLAALPCGSYEWLPARLKRRAVKSHFSLAVNPFG